VEAVKTWQIDSRRWDPRPEDIVAAARLVKKGRVISLALNFDNTGPQGAKSKYPAMGRINPVHTMLRTGTDAYSGVLDHRGIRAADDMVVMPCSAARNGTDSATCSTRTPCGTATLPVRWDRRPIPWPSSDRAKARSSQAERRICCRQILRRCAPRDDNWKGKMKWQK